MDLLLAVDLRSGLVVHGERGDRSRYRPLTWGLSPSADPERYVRHIGPRFLYIADLDRITGAGSHEREVASCSALVERAYVDRGRRDPSDYLHDPKIINIAATETSIADLSLYPGGYLSLDLKGGLVMPAGQQPVALLEKAGDWHFEGCIVLNIEVVGTGAGVPEELLVELRAAYDLPLLYGGGVAGPDDLDLISRIGLDGAIVATAVHRGRIPLDAVRRGTWC